MSDDDVVRGLRVGWLGGAPARYELTRFALLRALGFIYTVAFAIVCAQWEGLIGARGLLPAARYVERLGDTSFFEWPTLFRFGASDALLRGCGWLGLLLALAVLLGVDNALVMLALWAIYLSFCHVGQIFWGYGWEILLLEAGFLAIFLSPLASIGPLRARLAAPQPVFWMLRWLVLRVMLGAGLIKLRGDDCWRELTCLAYHYETQPVPGPLSALFHAAPLWFHKAGALFNHFVELVVPFFVFGPRTLRYVAGALVIGFQAILIVSGNLSFLNWLTIAVALACFDDALLERVMPARLRARAAAIEARGQRSRARNWGLALLSVLVLVLSVGPALNMLSPSQAMNTSFDPLHLVNSYGAFGSVGRERYEVVLQGSSDGRRYVDYELPCKPGAVDRRPCWITPYHYRLDWQLWFAAMSEAEREPWLVHLVHKLLEGEPAVLRLFDDNPFPSAPPRFVRAELYRYRFARAGEAGVWQRTRAGAYLEPVSLEHPALRQYLAAYGFD